MARSDDDYSGLVGCLAGLGAVLMGLWLAFFDIPVCCGWIIIDAYHRDSGRTEALYVTPVGLAFRAVVFIGFLVLVARALLRARRRRQRL